MTDLPLFLEGAWVAGETSYQHDDTYSGQFAATVQVPGREQVSSALRALATAQAASRLTAHDRFRILARASDGVRRRSAEFADTIITDTGFTVTDAEREVSRAVETLRLCGEEANRLTGRMVPLEGAPGVSGRFGYTMRRPLGVVCAITPFNSPLNTVCHKVGPALAAGNAVLLKPAAETPLTAALLVRVLLEAGLPEDLIALVQGEGADVGQWLLDDPTPAFYAFTGSTRVGEHIRRSVGLRRTQLELGSLASTIVCDDADVAAAAALCVNAAFRKAGQVCTSVQRLYVQRPVQDELVAALGEQLRGRPAGDPRLPETFVGPLIRPAAADRVSSWVGAAVECGARVVSGGGRSGAVLEPTILTDATTEMRVMREEVFGPVVVLRPFDDLDEAIAEANDTPYGLAAGVFTASLGRALRAAENLRVGTVHINETSSSRVDLMPFAGVKASGTGAEGPRYAVAEMTEERLVTIGAGPGDRSR
ncbi:aldehyde dehydrogenase family protein [Nonomuraea sp. B5E05]|uniref:aldehyde dehydrogenase family protein n=1 Tax=Nonomuraea sp. B5E05 TaxID=3153569 RepID=UPI003261A571